MSVPGHYLISDVPHLVKTTRNCWYSSAFGGVSTTMNVIEQDSSSNGSRRAGKQLLCEYTPTVIANDV